MPPARILIVDDDPDFARLVRAELRSAGHHVVHAVDGVTATQAAIGERPDLILLDLNMPGGDGHTVAARLKTNTKTMAIPVIYLTARGSAEDRQKAADGGAAAYIVKPLQPGQLLPLVERALQGN